MARYAIGDIQGCYRSFRKLLQAIDFDSKSDELWIAGDLVNRGPDSLSVIELIRSLGSACRVVLGNHEFSLISVYEGYRRPKGGDTFFDILDSPEAEDHVRWIASQPLVIRDDGFVMTHAGLSPRWGLDQTLSLSEAISDQLVSRRRAFLGFLAGKEPPPASEAAHCEAAHCEAAHWADLREAVNVLTSVRACDSHGKRVQFKGEVSDIPEGYAPWYHFLDQGLTETVLFGHWAAHGFAKTDRWICLDSGCVWGNELTAVCLDTLKVTAVPSQE